MLLYRARITGKFYAHHAYPCLVTGSQIPKGRGECSMHGVRRAEPNHFAQAVRQCKSCMIRVLFPEDEIQWGITMSRCHTVDKVTSRLLERMGRLHLSIQCDRHAGNKLADGIESRSNHDITSPNVNAGSSKLVREVNPHLYDDGVFVVPNGWPVMGSAGGPAVRGNEYKLTAMSAKARKAGGKEDSFCVLINDHERRIASAF